MENIKVSVIIPTYNRAHILARAIDSVLQQTFKDFVLIVVDDGSSDNTEELMKRYLDDSRVKYHRLEQNAGVSNARNTGADLAETEWIAFHDSDDEWHCDKLEKQMNYLESNPDCGMVYSAYAYYKEGMEGYIKIPRENILGDVTDALLLQNSIGAPTVVIKKEVFQQIGGYNTKYPSLEDWDFAIKASMATTIGYIDECLMDAHFSANGVGENGMNYCKARCMLIADYRAELEKRKLFDTAVMNLLNHVSEQDSKAIDVAKNMLMKELLERM